MTVAEAAGAATQVNTGETAPLYAVEKPRMPLVWKLFGVTALLIAVVVGIAVAITIQRASSVARQTVDKSIAGAARLFEDLERRRLNALALPVQLLGNDSNFVAYIQRNYSAGQASAPATTPQAAITIQEESTTDLPSLNDQLEQRRTSFGSDLVVLIDDQGRVITRTDQPSITAPSGEDLYDRSPVVRAIVDNPAAGAATGVVTIGNRLYHAAIAPVAAGTPPIPVAFLLNGSAIDENFANSIARSTNADVMFVPAGSATAVRSSGAPSFGLQQMHGVDAIIRSGKRMAPQTQTIGGGSYVLTGEPLAAGKQIVGAAVFLRSVDREMAPFRQIENTLVAGGGAALLLAFILSWLIAKRMTRPIEQLARMAQAVTAGDYSVQPAGGSSDEVGILGRSFAKMISSLRDKAELEQLYNEMATRSAEREAIPRIPEPARLEDGTVLVTDLRSLPVPVSDDDAIKVMATISRLMKIQEAEVVRQEGSVREVAGHRLVSVFRGDRGMIHAIRAARAINEEIATQGAVPGVTIAAGISTGEFVSGSVELSRESSEAVVGNAPLLALLFAWHAPSGHAYISYDTAQAAGNDILTATTREEVRLKWLSQPLAVASLPLVSLTTGVIRTPAMATMETMKLTTGGPTAPLPAQPSAELQPGSTFASRYRIEQVIGRGGMGVVYRANDTQLDEIVAIKTLPGDVMQRSPEDLERFKREIRLARKITHRNVLRTYDYGEAEGVYFISMEFVRGYTLAELMAEAAGRQIAPRVAMGIARQVCRGLQAAHEQGIIHRDIKPQNVLIDAKGEVKLMDFGIARMAEAPQAMTQAGLIVGTPHYMSPEQVRGELLDARSDVYAMGVLMYEMLVGARPFESSSLTGVLTAHITETPKPPIDRRPAIGERVNAIVLRCLAKDPRTRYADAGALLADLDAVQVPAAA